MGLLNIITRILGSGAAINKASAVKKIITNSSDIIEDIIIYQEDDFEDLKDIVTPELVKKVFIYTPLKNIEEGLPLILHALEKQKLLDKGMILYALSTLFVENDKFTSSAEVPSKWSTKGGNPPYDFSNYVGKGGNKNIEEASLYRGAGYIQLTLKENYTYMDKKLELDGGLIKQGYKAACVPQIAAAIMAQYLKDRESQIRDAIDQRDFLKMRKIVNGPACLHWEKFRTTYLKFERLI